MVNQVADPVEGRQRLAPELRQSLIVEAASRVLARDPEWTVQTVAEEAGVSDKLLYLYYPGGVLEQLAEQVAANLTAGIPAMFADIPADLPKTDKELHERVSIVISRAIDWVESVEGAWMFGPERDRLSSTVGRLWADGQVSIAVTLAGLTLHGLKDTPAVRSGIHAELKAFEAMAYDFKSGVIDRKQLEAVAVARFDFLFTKLIPSILS